ncbi:MAG: GNAT family N-acetyltransferase [Pseudomonadota bacterium]
MIKPVFREYTDTDEPLLLRLNQAVVDLTSPLDSARLQQMRAQGCQITIAEHDGNTIGLSLCFTDGSDYDSTNYQWFNQRIKQFLYIDRIIVAEESRGMGAGQHFYAQLKAQAAQHGLHWLAAEINSKPPNTASLAFHRKQGFVETGVQSMGDKSVSMQLFSL